MAARELRGGTVRLPARVESPPFAAARAPRRGARFVVTKNRSRHIGDRKRLRVGWPFHSPRRTREQMIFMSAIPHLGRAEDRDEPNNPEDRLAQDRNR